MKTIELSQGYVAIVDDEDYDRISAHSWMVLKLRSGMYAYRKVWNKGKPYNIYMHREVMNAPQGMCVDHIDHQTLRNTKDNLRICTYAQNMANAKKSTKKRMTSRYKGVRFNGRGYVAALVKDGQRHYVGCFKNEADAAIAVDRKALELWGEFAHLNFPYLLEKKPAASEKQIPGIIEEYSA